MCAIDWELALRYLTVLLDWSKVLVGWPLIVLIIVWIVIHKFREELAHWLRNNKEGNLGPFGWKQNEQPQTLDVSPGLPEAAVNQANLQDDAPPEVVPEGIQNDPAAMAELNYIKTKPVSTLFTIRTMSEYLQFEKCFSFIYGTQVRLLVHLEENAGRGKLSELIRFFVQYQGKSKNTSYEFSEYLKYLEVNQLIVPAPVLEDEEWSFNLTDKGRRFLNYIRSEYKGIWDLKPN